MILHDEALLRSLYLVFPDDWEALKNTDRVQPASVDLTIEGPLMRVESPGYSADPIRPGHSEGHEVGMKDGQWVLRPGNLYLLSTKEKIVVPENLLGRLDGRSSWARVGLRVHATAGFLDPGFCGKITMELDVVGPPVALRPGDSVCQVSFHELTGKSIRPYGTKKSKYQGQTGVTIARGLDQGGSR